MSSRRVRRVVYGLLEGSAFRDTIRDTVKGFLVFWGLWGFGVFLGLVVLGFQWFWGFWDEGSFNIIGAFIIRTGFFFRAPSRDTIRASIRP